MITTRWDVLDPRWAHGFACPRALSHKGLGGHRVVDPRGLDRAVALVRMLRDEPISQRLFCYLNCQLCLTHIIKAGRL